MQKEVLFFNVSNVQHSIQSDLAIGPGETFSARRFDPLIV
jgi:hypothetical protein